MQIAILIFDRVTALEAVAPYEVLSRLPAAQVTFVGERVGPVRCDTGRLTITADAVLEELPHPDIVVVPGGAGRDRHMTNGAVHQWLRAAAVTTDWMIGIGEGALILASAGLLNGRQVATTTASARRELETLGALPGASRAIFDGAYATAADGTAALELARELATRIRWATDPANFPARHVGCQSESDLGTTTTSNAKE
ncbi:DJ-1/PfpI family protein [Glaciibacter sp. 2TAF33]|uniref:DJ-1/PfpI family protein n=1 Tax=Glaciibacter sp. 2TAF33 TaxID=3233015 RepID=UPI003F8FB07F